MDTPATLQAFVVHRALAQGAALTDHCLLRIRAVATPTGPRPALSVVLCLDNSGSMGGEPLAQVVDSARKIADMLEERDDLAVVAFAAAASTVSPMRRLTTDARGATRSEVNALQAGGGTNMSAGIAHAALMFGGRDGDGRQVLLLLSDGQPNIGSSTPHALAEEVRRVRERGVVVSTLGYGAGHNDDVMIAVADAGGGRYAFVADPKLAAGSFARALGAQRDVVLEGVELLLTPADGVEIRKVYGDPQTSFGAGGLRVKLSDLAAGDELNVVVEVRVTAPVTAGPWSLLAATLTGRTPVTRASFAQESAARAEVVPDGRSDLDPTALVAVGLALAEEARTKARALADRRDFRGAAAVLREARQALMETPGYQKGSDDPLDDAVEALTDDITNMEKVPDVEEYQKIRKAARDYGSFAQSNLRAASVPLAKQTPSMVAYQQQMMPAAVAPDAYLVIERGPGEGTRFRLGVENDIGRGANATVRVHDGNVSRIHTRVVFNAGGYWAIDCGSTNGTYVNGSKVERAPLSKGSVIDVGGVRLRFES